MNIRSKAQHRIGDCQQRDQQQENLAGEDRESERQVALQERHTGCVPYIHRKLPPGVPARREYASAAIPAMPRRVRDGPLLRAVKAAAHLP